MKQLHKNPNEIEEVVSKEPKEEPKVKEESHKINILSEEKIQLLESEELFSEKDVESYSLDDASLLMDGILKGGKLKKTTNEQKNEIAKDNFFSSIMNKQDKFKDQQEKQEINKKALDYQNNKQINNLNESSINFNNINLDDILNLAKVEQLVNKESEKSQEKFKTENEDFNFESILKTNYFDRLLNKAKDISSIKDSFVKIDIYSDSLLNYLEYSIIESAEVKNNFNVSLVMKYLTNELNKLSDEALSPENRFKKKHFIKVAELLSHTPIKDAQNFKKVYDMHRESQINI